MVTSLIIKHGVVPISCMPEAKSSIATRPFFRLLRRKVCKISQWVRSITPNSGHSGISIAERAVRLHNSGIRMARIQFCRFRPRNRILRSPARISRCMWHVGTRAKKLMFELADFLHTRTKTKHFRTRAGMQRPAQRRPLFIFGNRVCDKFESFVYAAKFCSFRSFWNLEF